MAAKYRVTHQPGKGYHFTLLATNGQVIATSEQGALVATPFL